MTNNYFILFLTLINLKTKKMKKLFLLAIAALLFSCQKDNDLQNEKTYPNYYPLEIGNYWVYENYQIKPSGEEILGSFVDSIVINRDTIINGNVHYIMEGKKLPLYASTWSIIDIVRDSSGYIVNHEGMKRFAYDNYSDILVDYVKFEGSDTMYTLTYKMEQPEFQVSVPAGTFDVVNYQGTVISYNAPSSIPNPRYNNNYFVENIGKIHESWHYFHSPDVNEKRLVRYHIQE